MVTLGQRKLIRLRGILSPDYSDKPYSLINFFFLKTHNDSYANISTHAVHSEMAIWRLRIVLKIF